MAALFILIQVSGAMSYSGAICGLSMMFDVSPASKKQCSILGRRHCARYSGTPIMDKGDFRKV